MGEELGSRHPQDGEVVQGLHLIADTGDNFGGTPSPLPSGHLSLFGLPDQCWGPLAITIQASQPFGLLLILLSSCISPLQPLTPQEQRDLILAEFLEFLPAPDQSQG